MTIDEKLIDLKQKHFKLKYITKDKIILELERLIKGCECNFTIENILLLIKKIEND